MQVKKGKIYFSKVAAFRPQPSWLKKLLTHLVVAILGHGQQINNNVIKAK